MGFTEYSLKYGAYITDDEHERLFALLEELRFSRGSELKAGAVTRVLNSFTAVLCRHFGSEEALLAKLDQTGLEYEWHCLAHNSLLEKIVEMNAGIKAGDPCVPAQLADVITGWLIEHNIIYDNRMHELVEVTEQETRPILEIACRPLVAMTH